MVILILHHVSIALSLPLINQFRLWTLVVPFDKVLIWNTYCITWNLTQMVILLLVTSQESQNITSHCFQIFSFLLYIWLGKQPFWLFSLLLDISPYFYCPVSISPIFSMLLTNSITNIVIGPPYFFILKIGFLSIHNSCL